MPPSHVRKSFQDVWHAIHAAWWEYRGPSPRTISFRRVADRVLPGPGHAEGTLSDIAESALVRDPRQRQQPRTCGQSEGRGIGHTHELRGPCEVDGEHRRGA